MIEHYTAYKIWAPDQALWSQWAKPVLFTQAFQTGGSLPPLPPLERRSYMDGKTAMIVDLPGASGVLEGLALARVGFRPVPLYNGVFGPNRQSMMVDVTPIVETLFQGVEELASLSLPADAPPVFLLDANRMDGTARQAGKYDNRWCVFPQDMPSAAFLREQGIEQIYIRTNAPQNDLRHILLRYQQKGIRLYHIEGSGAIRELTVVRPSKYQSVLYRFQTMAGLTRNAAGGFGGKIPEATQSSSSSAHYYRMG